MTEFSKTLVLDNGAYQLKYGYAENVEGISIAPNAVIKAKNDRKRVYIANEIDSCKDLTGLFYGLPFQKGYLLNWDLQRRIWDCIFNSDRLDVDCDSTCLVFTEPWFNFKSIQESLDEIFFEEYQFSAVWRGPGTSLSAFRYATEHENSVCVVVVDSGYSFNHIIPYFNGRPIRQLIMRIDVGGKALTNYLKDVVSYRQLNVLEETYVMNQCKEDACFVSSSDFYAEMAAAKLPTMKNLIAKDYVLPDFLNIHRGFLRTPGATSKEENEQLIHLKNERFAIPEILFHPSDIGINQMGLTEAIAAVINRCPSGMQSKMFENIVLTGGNCNFPGFKDRVYNDVRSSASDFFDVNVILDEKPELYAWHGGRLLSKSPYFPEMIVTKKEYEEHGQWICSQKFAND